MKDKIFKIVKEAVTELNEELEYDSLKNVSENTPIFGGDNSIDSLALVRLVSVLENEIGTQLDKQVTLADEKVMSQRNTPFKTVGTIVDFILAKMKE